MTITTYIVILIVLAVASVATHLVRKQMKAEEAAKVKAQMEKHNEMAKNQAIEISDRLRGQVTNHKIHWLTMTDHGATRTYLRYEDLLNSEELTIDEKSQMDAIVRHLGRLREFRAEHVHRPQGYTVHMHPRFGKVIQYSPGMKIIGERNKMAAVIQRKEGTNEIFIEQIHVSLDLGNQLSDVYVIADADGTLNKEEWARFQEDYIDDDNIYPSFESEIIRYNQMTAEVKNYNLHLPHFKHLANLSSLEYHGVRVNPTDTRHIYKNAAVIPSEWEI